MFTTVFGQRKWNWPRSISPVGSYEPFGFSRTGAYWLENVSLISSRYASGSTSITRARSGCAVGQW